MPSIPKFTGPFKFFKKSHGSSKPVQADRKKLPNSTQSENGKPDVKPATRSYLLEFKSADDLETMVFARNMGTGEIGHFEITVPRQAIMNSLFGDVLELWDDVERSIPLRPHGKKELEAWGAPLPHDKNDLEAWAKGPGFPENFRSLDSQVRIGCGAEKGTAQFSKALSPPRYQRRTGR